MGGIVFGVDRYGDREHERQRLGVSKNNLGAYGADIVEVELLGRGWAGEGFTGYAMYQKIGTVVQPVRYRPVPRWCHA